VAVEKQHKGKQGKCRPSSDDIQPKGGNTFDVRRQLVDYYTGNLKKFNSLGWSGPYDENNVKGWEIGGFGCNSPLHFAGLRRGDVILSVNGKNTRNLLQLFGAYRKLKHDVDFEVLVLHKGQRKLMRYRLV